MPELPEVETTRRGIEPHVVGRRIERVVTRISALRWPIPAGLPSLLEGERVIEFGATTPAQDRYAKSGDRVALVQDRFSALLTSPPEQFVDRRPLLGRTAVGGRKVGGDFTPEELEAFSTMQATRIEPVPAVIGGHYITVRTDNGKETRFNYDFRDGGVVLLRRGDKFVYVLDRNLAATIGMSVD